MLSNIDHYWFCSDRTFKRWDSSDKSITFRRLATIIITFIGLISASLTIYAFFFQEKKIALQYEIIANSNVLDIRAELTKLDILYNGNSLKQKNQNLRIVNLRIKNTGTENILNNFYDDKDPLGFRVTDGEIIENPEVLDASNDYLRHNLVVTSDSTNMVRFSKVIIESKEYFVLKLLILHKHESNPNIIPVGKVAGVGKIALVNMIEVTENKSFFKEVFGGNLWVQMAKIVSYFLIALATMVIIIISGVGISGLKDKVKRRKVVKEFISKSEGQVTRMDEVIFERYKEDGADTISSMDSWTSDERELNQHYHDWLESKKKDNFDVDSTPESLELIRSLNYREPVDSLITDGLVIKEGDQLKINQTMKKMLTTFVLFLVEKGELKKKSNKRKKKMSASDTETTSDEDAKAHIKHQP